MKFLYTIYQPSAPLGPPPLLSSLPCPSSHGSVALSVMDDIQNQVLSLPSAESDRQIMTAAQEAASI